MLDNVANAPCQSSPLDEKEQDTNLRIHYAC